MSKKLFPHSNPLLTFHVSRKEIKRRTLFCFLSIKQLFKYIKLLLKFMLFKNTLNDYDLYKLSLISCISKRMADIQTQIDVIESLVSVKILIVEYERGNAY